MLLLLCLRKEVTEFSMDFVLLNYLTVNMNIRWVFIVFDSARLGEILQVLVVGLD